MPAKFEAFYVVYGDDEVFIKKRKYVLKPSEAVKLAQKIGIEHFNVMKVESLSPFRARHLEQQEILTLFEKWSKVYKKGGKKMFEVLEQEIRERAKRKKDTELNTKLKMFLAVLELKQDVFRSRGAPKTCTVHIRLDETRDVLDKEGELR